MTSSVTDGLAMLTEKILVSRIKDGSLRYCPTMDLFAIITADEQVEVYRLNGQKVFNIARKRSCKTVVICWKPNGALLAIAYSDNSVSLIATQGGKLVHQLQCPVFTDAGITSLSWTVNFTDVQSIRDRLGTVQREMSLDDVIHRGFLGEISKAKLDLPADLAVLDVEGVLPKLSVLPPGGKEGDVFTSRASIDSLFHSKDPKANFSDALLVGLVDGGLYLSVHDFFEIGRFEPRQVSGGANGYEIVKSASHPYISTLGLVLRKLEEGKQKAYFVPLDLRLVSDSGKQFSHLAAKATQMHNVLRYIKECQMQIDNEFKASQTLPHRFIANVEEDLQKDESCDFVTAAYHLVATGNCSPVMKEWLTDQLGDRGQKRWEKAAVTGYENTRRLAHESLLPALDRLVILCNRLKGLALFQETASTFGLETVEIDHVLDTIRCLQLLGHNTMIASDSELRQTSAFCSWLRQEIDVQATETTNPDEPEKEPMFDYADLLSYIEGPLRHSLLYELLEINREDGQTGGPTTLPPPNSELYDDYKAALRRVKAGSRAPKHHLPGMAALVDRLQSQCSIVFGNIASTQHKKLRFGDPVILGDCDTKRLDMHMKPGERDTTPTCFVAVVAVDGLSMRVVKADLNIHKGISAVTSLMEASAQTAAGGRIVDTKFVDDHHLFILIKQPNQHSLFLLRYAGDAGSVADIDYDEVKARPSYNGSHQLVLGDEQSKRMLRHVFTDDVPPFVPARLEVNGRKGRRAVCVIAEDSTQYRVYDVDTPNDRDELSSEQGGNGDGWDAQMS